MNKILILIIGMILTCLYVCNHRQQKQLDDVESKIQHLEKLLLID